MHNMDEGDRLHLMGGAVVVEVVSARRGRASIRVTQPAEMDEEHERSPKRTRTHWVGCWRDHHDCAIVLLERLLRPVAVDQPLD